MNQQMFLTFTSQNHVRSLKVERLIVLHVSQEHIVLSEEKESSLSPGHSQDKLCFLEEPSVCCPSQLKQMSEHLVGDTINQEIRRTLFSAGTFTEIPAAPQG